MTDLKTLLQRAETASEQTNWAEARRWYKEILRLNPNHLAAQQGLQNLRRYEAASATIVNLLHHGDAALRAGEYQQAFNTYSDALNQAGQVRLLRYHPQLQEKRNQARDLLAHQQRVSEALQTAQSEADAGDLGAARQHLSQSRQTLPDSPAYQPLISQLETARQALDDELDTENRFHQANQAFQHQDFEEAIRLYQAIPSHSTRYADAQNYLRRAKSIWHGLKETLSAASTLFENGHIEAALAELDHLRRVHPANPNWQRLWVQLGLAHTQAELATGRHACLKHEFRPAQRHFLKAREACIGVLDVAPDNPLARRHLPEATTAYEIALQADQAQSDYESGHLADSLATLKQALAQLEQTQSALGEDSTLLAVLRHLYHSYHAEGEQGDLKTALGPWQTQVNQLTPASQSDIAALLSQLQPLLTRSEPYPTLHAEFTALYQQAEESLHAQRRYQHLRREAESYRQQGHWTAALESLQSAAALFNRPPADLAAELAAEQHVHQHLAETAPRLQQHLTQADQDYLALKMPAELNASLKPHLTASESLLKQAETICAEAEGHLPSAWQGLQKRWETLQRKTALLEEAQTARSPIDSLRWLRQALARWPDDEILQAASQHYQQALQNDTALVCRRALRLAQAGELSEALDLLSHLLDWQAGQDDDEAAALYQHLKQAVALQNRLSEWRTRLLEAPSPALSQPETTAALLTDFHQLWAEVSHLPPAVLSGQLDPTAALPPAAEDLPTHLKTLSQQLSPQLDPAIADTLSALRTAAHRCGGAVAQTLLTLAEKGVALQKTHTWQIELLTAQQNTDWLTAYQLAQQILSQAPHDAARQAQAADLRSRLLETTVADLSEALADLDSALSEGNFQTALSRLTDLAENRWPLLTTALPNAPELRPLHVELHRLRHQAQQRHRLSHTLAEAETNLRLLRTPDDLQILKEMMMTQLKNLPQTLDWPALTEAERKHYYHLLEQIQQAAENATTAENWANQAEIALEEGHYSQALTALNEACQLTPLAEVRANLTIQRNQLRPQAEQHAAQQALFNEAMAHFNEGRYQNALPKLYQAQNLGLPVDNLLAAAHAGERLEAARQAWASENWPETGAELNQLFALVPPDESSDQAQASNPYLQPILKAAESLWTRLERKLAAEREARSRHQRWLTELNEASRHLSAGDLSEAETILQKILSQAPDHAPAQRLHATLQSEYELRRLHHHIETALAEGRPQHALALTDTILSDIRPADPATLALRQRITQSSQAHQALQEALFHARNQRFDMAQVALEQAISLGAETPHLLLVQEKIADWQHQQALDLILPIKENLRDGNFVTAWQHCQQAQKHHHLPDFVADLATLHREIVQQWTAETLKRIQQQLTLDAPEAHTLASLNEAVITLLTLDPPAPTALHRQLQEGYEDVQYKRLALQFEAALAQAEAGQFASALKQLRHLQRQAESLSQPPANLTGLPALDLSEWLYRATQAEMQVQAQQQQAETARQDFAEALQAAHLHIQRHLQAQPADYSAAVNEVERLKTHAGWNPQGEQLAQALVTRLEKQLSEARRVNQYSLARSVAAALQCLQPENNFLDSLACEQREKYQQALDALSTALTAGDLATAQAHRNQVLALQDGLTGDPDPRFDDLSADLDRQQTAQMQAQSLLRQMEAALHNQAWAEAVAKLQTAQNTLPSDSLRVETAALQAQFQQVAQAELAQHQFQTAADLCTWGRQLGPHVGLTALQAEVEAAQQAWHSEQLAAVETALAGWDVAGAQTALDKLQAQGLFDEAAGALQARSQQLAELAEAVQAPLQAAWTAIQARDFPAVWPALRQANVVAPSFYEAQRWRDYVKQLEPALALLGEASPADPDSLAQLGAHLAAAGAALRLKNETDVPQIGLNLLAWHRQALWEVHQLYQNAQQLQQVTDSPADFATIQADSLRFFQSPPPAPSEFRATAPLPSQAAAPPTSDSPAEPEAVPEVNPVSSPPVASETQSFVWDASSFALPSYEEEGE